MMKTASVDTPALVNLYNYSWQLLGLRTNYNKYLMGTYDLLLTFCITICYPLHLIIGMFFGSGYEDLFKNLTMNVACTSCSIKQILFRPNLHYIDEVNKLLTLLDKNIRTPSEVKLFHTAIREPCMVILKVCFVIYGSVWVTTFTMFLMGEEKDLLYPAWFPFDYKMNIYTHGLALAYQFLGILAQIIQNFANDAFAPLALCSFSGHAMILRERIGNIGFNGKSSSAENHRILIECVEDYKRLIKGCRLVEAFISQAMFVQFGVSAVNICSSVIVLVFYAQEPFTYIYYVAMCVGIACEIYFVCYYGSFLEKTFNDLPYSIFSSNWMDEGKLYWSSAIIFGEFSKKTIQLKAGRMLYINMATFFATMKMGYTFFCVIIRLKA